MFKAIFRFFRAIGLLLTGRINDARRALMKNPDVVAATYDDVIGEKKKNLNKYKDAVGKMIAQEEKKRDKLKTLTAEIQKYEKLKAGAKAKATKVAAKHNGNAVATKNDPDYKKCQQAFKDFSSTLEEKNTRADELEETITELESNIGDHKTSINSLLRDLEKIKDEKHETVADVISSREEKAIADMMSGISEDRTHEELSELRDLRREAKAGARMSRELAGLDSRREEDEFMEFATEDASTDEFDALIGISSKKESLGTLSEDSRTQISE